jgi:hypothetical protein
VNTLFQLSLIPLFVNELQNRTRYPVSLFSVNLRARGYLTLGIDFQRGVKPWAKTDKTLFLSHIGGMFPLSSDMTQNELRFKKRAHCA